MKNKAVLGAFLALALTAGAVGNVAFANENPNLSLNVDTHADGRNENHLGLGAKIGAWLGFHKEIKKEEKKDDAQDEHTTSTMDRADKNLVGIANVTRIDGSVIYANVDKNGTTTTWAITTNADTKFFIRGAHKATTTKTISDISVGDRIGVAGTVTDNDGTDRAITASFVVQWNPTDKVRAVGTVLSVDNASGTFVLDTAHKGNVTIQTDASTTIKNGTSTGTLADLTVGSKVTVKGMWNSLKSFITAVKVRIFTK